MRLHRIRVGAAFLERLSFHWCQCIVSTSAEIRAGFVIRHPGNVIVGSRVTLGRNCEIRQGVTLGGSVGKRRDGRSQPLLGDDVQIGAGAQVVGPIVVGDRVFIGANAVVTSDLPSDSIAAGIPARVIRRGDQSVSIYDQEGSTAAALRSLRERIGSLEQEVQNMKERISINEDSSEAL